MSGAPTTIVSPEAATEVPKWSLGPALDATSFCRLQVPPERVKPYAEPPRVAVGTSSSGDPTAIVSTDAETELPKWSPALRSGAGDGSFACSVQVAPDPAKTYAAPARVEASGAPATS